MSAISRVRRAGARGAPRGIAVAYVEARGSQADRSFETGKEIAMGDVYTVVVAAILLFPWSLVGVILAGAMLRRGRPRATGTRRAVRCG